MINRHADMIIKAAKARGFHAVPCEDKPRLIMCERSIVKVYSDDRSRCVEVKIDDEAPPDRWDRYISDQLGDCERLLRVNLN